MRKQLASIWIVPLALAAIIVTEIVAWVAFSPTAALVVAIVTTQIAAGVLVLWLSQRQKRHALQIERTVERHAVQIDRAVGKLEKNIEVNHLKLGSIETEIRSADNDILETLRLNTAELRRLSQMPTPLTPHPPELRFLDQLTEIQTTLKVLHSHLTNLTNSRFEAGGEEPETPGGVRYE